ncbi:MULTISPECIES: hypothetical protein [unclassified Streptomyces]|jgi:hypothetical protein|uniref:hypothetical protein n=1 Tax=unclassified Streptomyces TaxID=2593676 RepID=UPI0029B621AC|nr:MULTISPECIES: hypothetical protein [unclassified Streptomyces]MDX3767590.1 hypothetical protein [Streptomyces sp. AK08-01B]MDX3820501.1 hypothetical protein [Streptomyces sp. AK08-01A]
MSIRNSLGFPAGREVREHRAWLELELVGQVGPDTVVVQLVARVAEEEHRVFA